MWPVKLDLSRISYVALRGAVAPILPGGLIALGCLFGRSDLTARLFSSPSNEYYIKAAIAVFLAYVVGFALHIGVILTSVTAAVILKELLRARLYPGEPWKDKQWRALARQFIGKELVPAMDEVAGEQSSVTDTPQIPVRKMMETVHRITKGISEDHEWSWWYSVVGVYFYKVDRLSGLLLIEFSALLESIGWATIIIFWKYVPGSPLLWTSCVLIVVLGFFGCFIGIVAYEVTPWTLAADMLHHLKQEKHTTPTSGE
jgi:hypothetical protein